MEFESSKATIGGLLQDNYVYACPLFQRQYRWEDVHINEFRQDIERLMKGDVPRVFLGALTLFFKSPGTVSTPGVYWVIDGQQRITTTYLTLLALLDVTRQCGRTDLLEDIEKYLFRNVKGKRQSHITPTLEDFGAFKAVHDRAGYHLPDLAAVNAPTPPARMQEAYETIRKWVDGLLAPHGEFKPETFEFLGNAIISGLDFIAIYLGDDHDPQAVFDRLNNAGMKLDLADLIKNVTFQPIDMAKESHQAVLDLHAKEWKPFYQKFGSSKDGAQAFADFAFPYAIVKDSQATKATAVSRLEKTWKDGEDGLEPMDVIRQRIRDMSRYAREFITIRNGPKKDEFSKELQLRVERLARFGAPSVSLPYLLCLFEASRAGNAPETEVIECLDVLESFFVRRVIVGLEPTGLHAVFRKLWPTVGTNAKKLRSELTTATIEFPTDADFQKAAETKDLYNRKKRNYILLEWEIGTTTSPFTTDIADVEADHLLPQNPEGDDWAGISKADHQELLHTWGNLVLLTSKENKLKSNRSWAETMLLGLDEEAKFAGTRSVLHNQPTWLPSDIRKRNKELAAWALQRWSDGPTKK